MLETTIAGSLPKPFWLAKPKMLWAPWVPEGAAMKRYVAMFEAASRLNPKDVRPYLAIARLRMRSGQQLEAVAAAETQLVKGARDAFGVRIGRTNRCRHRPDPRVVDHPALGKALRALPEGIGVGEVAVDAALAPLGATKGAVVFDRFQIQHVALSRSPPGRPSRA